MSGVPCRWGNNLANHQKAYIYHHKVIAWLFGLTVLSVEWFHICCYWMSTKRLWFRVSMTQLQYIITMTHPCFFPPYTFFCPTTVKRPTASLTLHLVFTYTRNDILKMMPAEPGALIKYMRTQICTFWQSGGGFPTETRGWVSQNLNLKYNNEMKTSF